MVLIFYFQFKAVFVQYLVSENSKVFLTSEEENKLLILI